jgi:hypothetical protein
MFCKSTPKWFLPAELHHVYRIIVDVFDDKSKPQQITDFNFDGEDHSEGEKSALKKPTKQNEKIITVNRAPKGATPIKKNGIAESYQRYTMRQPD